ncbi:MAG TPA: DUF2795 domain-containing protein [Pseudonocardiaceae bacterium]|jgi:hypothetical protein|nr:DUF2795 domain-containing protein [Pseudonocardiaceae bacterium]
MDNNGRRSLAAILQGLVFPAVRWEIVTQAGMYGADAGICDRLRRLPVRRSYVGVADVAAALDSLPS